jgi:LysR family pca operon transcriptional activator
MIEDRIKHRHLACFAEVARQKSIGKAAHVLAVSQPAVSKTIRELEEILGVELFDRSHRTVMLTPPGEVFQRFAGASIAALRQGVELVDGTARMSRRVVRVGALPAAMTGLLPVAVERAMRFDPTAVIRVVGGGNEALLGEVRDGGLDMALTRLEPSDALAGLAFELLWRESLVFAARADHPLSGDGFAGDRLGAFPLLLPPPDHALAPAVERALIRRGVGAGSRRVEAASPEFARAFVLATDAIWVTAAGDIAGESLAGRLVTLATDDLGTLGAVGLVRRAEGAGATVVEAFAGLLREVASEVSRPGSSR